MFALIFLRDYYEYSQDDAWLTEQGYPQLLKPVAQFWASQLQQDRHFEDGTLVVNPCTSPEHGPTTFGCTHYQQLIYQVFETVLQSASIVGEADQEFLENIKSKLSTLDKGLHIGRWGQIQEWKLDIDEKNNTHRHLSHLIGWHPGWSISAYQGGYTNKTIQDAVATSLYSRGIGIDDANAGWEKVWRSAAWARLNNTERAYYELRLSIYENWAPNGFSMYSGKNEPFQIDANFGFPGAVLSMLVVDLPQAPGDDGTLDRSRRGFPALSRSIGPFEVVIGCPLPFQSVETLLTSLRLSRCQDGSAGPCDSGGLGWRLCEGP